MNSVINFAQKTINGFIRAINSAISFINHIPGVNIKNITEINIPRMEKGGLVTDSVLAKMGEGKYDEAVLPLSDAVFERLAKGINKNNTQSGETLSEEKLYRAFLRALNEMPQKTTTFIANLNSKVIAKEVLKEQVSAERRFKPVGI